MKKTIIPMVLAGLLACPSMAYAADSVNEDREAQTTEQPEYGDGYSDFTYNNGWSGDVTDETQWDGVEHAHLGVLDYPSQPGDTYEHNLPGETQEYVERSQDGMTFWSDGSSIGARVDETPTNEEGWDNWQCMSSGNANFWWEDGNGDGQIDYVTHDCYGWNNPQPVDPEPVDPEPVDPEPVDPEPVDPEPVDPEPVDPSVEPSQPAEEPSDPAPVPGDTETDEPAQGPATEIEDNGTPTENSTALTTTEETTNDAADAAPQPAPAQPSQHSSEPAPGVDAGTPSPTASDAQPTAGSTAAAAAAAAAAGQSVPTQGTVTQGPKHKYEPRHRMPVTGATIADDVFFGILVLVGGAVVLSFRRKNNKED